MKQVLLLNNVPAPYFKPLFEKLGEARGWRLTVCYASAWNRDVGWKERQLDEGPALRTIILDQKSPRLKKRAGSSIAAAISMAEILKRERPDYLICYGYTLKPQITALAWAMFTRRPFAVIGDANIHCDTATGVKRLIKRWWLRRVARKASALITIGAANRMFWESYGARRKQLFEARFAVDNDSYARSVERRQPDAATLRARMSLSDKIIFLFVGRLVKRKNIDLIIRAKQQIDGDPVGVMIVGAGEERPPLEALAGGDPDIIFAGSVGPDDLPLYYAMADVLVLPAKEEPWGLVINEAMACGLPVIAHRDCGATMDLVAGDNGVVLETFSVEELAGAMESLVRDEGLRSRMRKRSREKIGAWSIDGAARGIINAVEASGK